LVAVSYGLTARASIQGNSELEIDFTNEKDASKKAVWSPADKLSVSSAGLGWDGEADASWDGWIQTRPHAIGYSWRPTRNVSVSVEIQPAMCEAGGVYLRYSSDRKHWTSWQALLRGRSPNDRRQVPAGSSYHGTIRVPYRDQQTYNRLLSEYSTMDVPWKSDEEAAVRWIVARDPDFFAEQIPFIGYVEFLVEQGFAGSRRVKSFNAELGFGMGGLHVPPRDPPAYKDRDVPWRFVAEGSDDDDSATAAPVEESPRK
jgi:hypothetical protein